jgi:hypothetical protein
MAIHEPSKLIWGQHRNWRAFQASAGQNSSQDNGAEDALRWQLLEEHERRRTSGAVSAHLIGTIRDSELCLAHEEDASELPEQATQIKTAILGQASLCSRQTPLSL